eukprot:scaffold421373_cov59-Attheya_sp.AAC.2
MRSSSSSGSRNIVEDGWSGTDPSIDASPIFVSQWSSGSLQFSCSRQHYDEWRARAELERPWLSRRRRRGDGQASKVPTTPHHDGTENDSDSQSLLLTCQPL